MHQSRVETVRPDRRAGSRYALWTCHVGRQGAHPTSFGQFHAERGSASLPSGELQNPNSSKQSLFASNSCPLAG
jgi:hypothetical protein